MTALPRLSALSRFYAAAAAASDLMRAGASPATVAAFVCATISADPPAGIALSHTIEDQAHPGTFAETVFSILAD